MRSTRSASAWMARVSRPPARCRLLPVLLAFAEGCQKGLLSLWQRAASLPRPFGLFSAKAPVLGAANGIKPSVHNIRI